MATNKHAQIRYLALDKCFSNYARKYFIEDLVEACNEAIYDFTGKHEGVKRRQVYEDIKFMESESGYRIELDRHKDGKCTYMRYANNEYSINKSPLNEVEVSRINEVLLTLSRFKGMPQFEWVDEISSRLQSISKQDSTKIIDFEQNQFLLGSDNITPLFNAIYFKRVLEISYMPFQDQSEKVHVIHPYFLKQYNLRWFLFGKNENSNTIMNMALDRIVFIKEIALQFKVNMDIDFLDYFEDIVGVTVLNKPMELVKLSIDRDLWPYIKTKPIHGSQRGPKEIDNAIILEFNLIINYEFISVLMSFGERLTVLEPEHLREKMKKRAKEMLRNYS